MRTGECPFSYCSDCGGCDRDDDFRFHRFFDSANKKRDRHSLSQATKCDRPMTNRSE